MEGDPKSSHDGVILDSISGWTWSYLHDPGGGVGEGLISGDWPAAPESFPTLQGPGSRHLFYPASMSITACFSHALQIHYKDKFLMTAEHSID